MHPSFTLALAALTLVSSVLSHTGGHSEKEIRDEIALRNVVTAHSKRAIDKCANSSAALALRERALARRVAAAKEIRKRKNLQDGASSADITRLIF